MGPRLLRIKRSLPFLFKNTLMPSKQFISAMAENPKKRNASLFSMEIN
jgi:hypothetical protein